MTLRRCERWFSSSMPALLEQQRVLDATSAAYAALQAERDRLREEFELLRRWAYGRRRERFLEAEGQRSLFDEPEGAQASAAFE